MLSEIYIVMRIKPGHLGTIYTESTAFPTYREAEEWARKAIAAASDDETVSIHTAQWIGAAMTPTREIAAFLDVLLTDKDGRRMTRAQSRSGSMVKIPDFTQIG